MPEKQQLYDNNNDGRQKHEQRNAVDAVHITHPLGGRRIGVFFLNIQVLGQLS